MNGKVIEMRVKGRVIIPKNQSWEMRNKDRITELIFNTIPVLACNSKVGFCPSRIFNVTGHIYDEDSYIYPNPPSGYKWWFSIFSDAEGSSFDIFYPINCIENQKIFIKVKGDLSYLPKNIRWIHGKGGLCIDKIWPIYLKFVRKYAC